MFGFNIFTYRPVVHKSKGKDNKGEERRAEK
jgi:hypothetical protein